MKKVVAVLISLTLMFGICACGSSSSSSASSADTDSDATVESTLSEDEVMDSMTSKQKQAYRKCKSYLSNYAFSKKGLTAQLKHEEFPTEDIKVAIKAIEDMGEVNWNTEAYEAAQGYLTDEPSLSKDEVLEKLEGDDWSQFTHEQAVYGADKAFNEDEK